jgi:DNA-binding response OmpR family regulator
VTDTMIATLLIADSDEDLDLYSVGLLACGIEVTATRTADDGTFIASVPHFDAIVLSVVAPHGVGWEGCERLRSHSATSGLPLVVLSASVRADRANRDRARRLGCAAFVAKPCTPERLAFIIRRVLAGERAIEDLGCGTDP